ncbi:MAG: hypothetical protein QGD90_09915 [Candidatus Hydrogenedentes bacterium]|nr:hypothetical protein [Candidatus Hydrogenedentota bacterium]
MSEKRCKICEKAFRPSRRHWKTQEVCLRKKCRNQVKKNEQQSWLRKNPGYFKGRYPSQKGHWDFAGYLREYRGKHPGYVSKDNLMRRKRRNRPEQGPCKSADIQELVHRREKAIFEVRSRRGIDRQETIRLQLDGVLDLLGGVKSADIQELVPRR